MARFGSIVSACLLQEDSVLFRFEHVDRMVFHHEMTWQTLAAGQPSRSEDIVLARPSGPSGIKLQDVSWKPLRSLVFGSLPGLLLQTTCEFWVSEAFGSGVQEGHGPGKTRDLECRI